MTTNADKGYAQAEDMRPKLKVGDIVRLTGALYPMKIVELQDYDNMAVCTWEMRDIFPVRSLVKIEPAKVE